MLIDKDTFELMLNDLDSIPKFKSKFAELQLANDSLFYELRKQVENMDALYHKADLLQNKLLLNQLELIRTEEQLKNYQIRYNKAMNIATDEEEPKIRYRTRYIFRDKQEKTWFYITWGIFVLVPTGVIVLTR